MKGAVVTVSVASFGDGAQATLFNQPGSGFDVLVASDAIGMGLNLNIGRVVFTRMEKFDGEATRRLLPAEALQIGGRAGRFGTAFPEGTVSGPPSPPLNCKPSWPVCLQCILPPPPPPPPPCCWRLI